MITNYSVQRAVEILLDQFFYNLPQPTQEYIAIVATVGIVGALFAMFIGLFTSRKTSAKVVILVVIITISIVFAINQYFDAKLIFENALSKIGV